MIIKNPTTPPMSTFITCSKTIQFNFLWIPIFIQLLLLLSSNSNAQSIMLPSNSDPSSYLSSKSSNTTTTNNNISSGCYNPDPTRNFRPVIGIVSHPGDGASGRLKNGTNVSYIASSYVKFVESAGGIVIPLIYTEPRDVLFKKLDLVHGVLFTGGSAKRGLYFDVVSDIFKKVFEKNDAGQFFPCYAICLGFELLTMIISKDNNILERFSASYMASSLQFVENESIQGTLFQRFPPDLLRKLSTDCIVMQNHKYGISPVTLQDNKLLSSFFKILTTSTDRNNKVYVSTAQAQHYPLTAFQWHPEKNAFEGGYSMIPHSEDAIQVTQWAANYLISEARNSPNRPAVKDVLDNLIYNYSPTYCGKAGRGFDEVYIFV